MGLQDPAIPCEDIPLEEAHSMRRGPRLEPWLYQTLNHHIHSRDHPPRRRWSRLLALYE
jgi:hypothetical protein